MERIQHERLVVATLAAAGQGGVLPSVEGLDLLLGLTEEEPMDPETRELQVALGLRS